MKAKMFILSTLLVLIFATDFSTAKRRGVSDYFYSNLSSHGKWIEMNDGLVVWRPYDSFGRWSPYAHGKWIWSNHGWYWDSFEVYGHIVYHYGRWHFDDYYGWIWIPDYEWAPAWVEWRYDNDYIGWAPLPPYAIYNMNYGVRYSKAYVISVGWWKFVAIKHFGSSNVYGHFVSKKYRDRIYRGTKSQLDYGYERDRIMNRSIDPRIVERASNTKIRETEIVRSGLVGNDREPIVRNNDRIEVRQPSDIKRTESRDMKIESSNRKTNLDITNIEIGKREESSRKVNEETVENRKMVIVPRTAVQKENVSETKSVDRKTVRTEERTSNPTIQTRETVKQNVTEPAREVKVEVKREVQKQVQSEERRITPVREEPKQVAPVREERKPVVNQESVSRNRETERKIEMKRSEPAPTRVVTERQTETRNIERETDVRKTDSNVGRTSRESKPESRTSTTERSSTRERSSGETTTRRR